MSKRVHRSASLILIFAAGLACGCNHSRRQQAQKQAGISTEQQAADAAGFNEFSDRVKDYVKLHNSQEALLPPLKQTVNPEMIAAHQAALAQKIREARPAAKAGDVFAPAAVKSFQDVINTAMQGPRGANAGATMQQGAPLTETKLIVNQIYPDGIPHTTVPPTLLLVFPNLPDEVVYRVVVHDLVLLDLKANLVVDVLPGIIP